MLGMIVAKGNNKLWVNTINTESLKKKIQVKDIIRTINGKRVGDNLSTIQSPVRPMYIKFVRMVSVEVLEDKATEYYTDEEWMNSEEIPGDTGINNSDIESVGEGESMDSTEMELKKIREKDKKKKDEKEDDDSNYQSNDEGTSNDDDTNDESEPTREEDNEENERMDTTESITNALCCAGEFCRQEGGRAIIGMSHRCIASDGQLHGFPCSDGKSDKLIGMICKQCEADAMETEELDKGGDSEGQIKQKSKSNKLTDQSLTGKTSILTSIMRTGSIYADSRRGRGRGGRSAAN